MGWDGMGAVEVPQDLQARIERQAAPQYERQAAPQYERSSSVSISSPTLWLSMS